MSSSFGEFFAALRRKNTGMSLREFCERHGFDAGNLSKLERGKLAPPRSAEKLSTYAAALGVAEGSDEWIELFDRAAAARGELPEDLLSDEAVVDQLPVLFRTLRGERVGEEQLRRLLELIRRS